MHKIPIIGNRDDDAYSHALHQGLVIMDVSLQIVGVICYHKREGREPSLSMVGLTVGQHNMLPD